MASNYHPGVHRLSIIVVCWTVLLLTAGALVTSNDAALAVADWPTSFGSLYRIPPLVGGVKYEHVHRMIAEGLGLLVIALAVLLWLKEKRRWVRWLGVAAVGGVIAQGVLGGLTVLLLLHFWIPVMHAWLGQIMFAILVTIAVVTGPWWTENLPQFEDRGSPSVHTVVILNATVILGQVLLGAANRHGYLSIKPHVLGAFVVLGVVIWTAVLLRKRFEQSKEISKARILLHAIVGAQLLLGFGALWSRIVTKGAPQPMPVMVTLTVIHTVVGALLFATSILVVLICYRLVPRSREAAVATEREVTAG